MNKKLISLAVAAAMVAPAAALADATMYGKLHLSIDYVDMDDFVTYPGSRINGSASTLPSNGFGGFVFPHAGIFGVPGSAVGAGYLPAGHSSAQPMQALGAYADALTFGVTDAGGNVISDPVPGVAAAAHTAYMDAINANQPEAIAVVEAINAGIAEGNSNADWNQLTAAVADALRAGAGPGYNGWDVTSAPGASRFGIKGSEDLGGGLKAIYQLEFGVDPADGSLSTRLRNSFVGLAGNWGTALVGRHDTPLKISTGKLDMFADTMADYNYTVGFDDQRASNAVAYISPSFSGFQFAGAIVAPGGEGTYTDIWTGTTVENNADGLAEAYSLAGIYKNGPFYGSVAYESFSDKLFNANNVAYQALYGSTADSYNKWRVGLGLLDWNGFTLSGVYESQSNVQGAPRTADSQLWQIQAGYKFGSNRVKGMYGQADLEKCSDPYGHGFRFTCGRGLGLVDNKDKSTWAIGFDHFFSKRTSAYALYTALSDDIEDADWSGFSIGMIHKF